MKKLEGSIPVSKPGSKAERLEQHSGMLDKLFATQKCLVE